MVSCFLGNEDPIKYPCDFPIKIMGEKRDGFADAIADVIRLHDPLFDAATLGMRLSSKGNYLSLTATVNATSREQLDNLYKALSSHPMVKVVL